MKQNELQLLVDLRKYLIHRHDLLDGKHNPATSVILQRDVAGIITESVRRIDVILEDYVKIGKQNGKKSRN